MSGLLSPRFESIVQKSPRQHANFDLATSESFLSELSLKFEKVNAFKEMLKVGQLTVSELSLATIQMNRLEQSEGIVFRSESHDSSHQTLMMRCEGVISTVVEKLKAFIDWIVGLVKSLFTSSSSKPSEPEVKKKNDERIEKTKKLEEDYKKEEKVPEKLIFSPGSLNQYFFYETEEEAIKELEAYKNNLSHLEGFLTKFFSFKFLYIVFPSGDEDNTKYFLEELQKDILGTASDISNVHLPLNENVDKGFNLTSKLAVGLGKSSTKGIFYKHLDIKETRDSKDIDIKLGSYIKGFGSTLLSSSFSTSNFSRRNGDDLKKKLEELEKIKSKLNKNNPVHVNNVRIAAHVFCSVTKLLQDIEKINNSLENAKSRLDKLINV